MFNGGCSVGSANNSKQVTVTPAVDYVNVNVNVNVLQLLKNAK